MRFSIVVVVIVGVLLAPQGMATAPPLPPDDFAYHFADADSLVIHWTAPATTDYTSAPAQYSVYVVQDGNKLPPVSIPTTQTEYSVDVAETSVYVIYVTAKGADGLESAPSSPLVVKGGVAYPHCSVFSYGLSPLNIDPAVGCLFPPPP